MGTSKLTAKQERTWDALTAMLTKLPTVLDAEMADEADLTHFEYTVLARLAESPEGMLQMSVLAVRTAGTLSRLSHVVRRLENQGLVVRKGEPGDRRVTNAIITPAGRARVETAMARHTKMVRTLLGNIDKGDLDTLTRISEGVVERIDHRS